MSSVEGLTSPGRIRIVAGVIALADLVLCYSALILMFQIEPTDEALRQSAKGKAVATLAVPSLVAAVLALIGAARRWGRYALTLAAVCGLLATGGLILI